MDSSTTVSLIVAFVGLQFAGVDGFDPSVTAGVLQRTPAASINDMPAANIRRGNSGPSMVAGGGLHTTTTFTRADKALAVMAKDARRDIARSQGLDDEPVESNPLSSMVMCVLSTVLWARTIFAILLDMFVLAIVQVPEAASRLASVVFNPRPLRAVLRQAGAAVSFASEVVYDVVEEIAYHNTFLAKLAVSVWVAVSLSYQTQRDKIMLKIDEELEGYGHMRIRTTRSSIAEQVRETE